MAFSSHYRPTWPIFTGIIALVAFCITLDTPAAQQTRVHLNPVIEKLSQGKHVFGVSTSDLSMRNARSLSRNQDLDYVYLDMEHNPMRFDQMEYFLAGMINKSEILRKGSTQPNVAVFARFAPYAHEEAFWVVKQALDIGLMGILLNNVETREQAANMVQHIRYPQRPDSGIPNPPGRRGSGAALAAWFWGISTNEYVQKADLWPLNPDGDLLLWVMIETKLGVQNADAIAQVPGVGGFYLGGGGDLSNSYGATDPNDPEVEEAFQQILSVCKNRKIACGGTVGTENVEKRLQDGYKIINFGGANGGLTAQNENVRQTALAAGAQR